MVTRQQFLGGLLGAVAIAAGFTLLAPPSSSAEQAVAIPAPALDPKSQQATETAVLAGGCFWGVQGVFQHVAGVSNAVSGYAGGDAAGAQYNTVSRGATRHAEAVQVTFDPRQISYAQILQIYFSVAHDPTQLNRQGPDRGTQYRSAIFPANSEQDRVARAYIAQLDQAKVYGDPIVTKIETDVSFFAAEDYHQDYLTRNPDSPYIVFNDLPKLEALKRFFPAVWRDTPVLVANAKKTG